MLSLVAITVCVMLTVFAAGGAPSSIKLVTVIGNEYVVTDMPAQSEGTSMLNPVNRFPSTSRSPTAGVDEGGSNSGVTPAAVVHDAWIAVGTARYGQPALPSVVSVQPAVL